MKEKNYLTFGIRLVWPMRL